jgi:prevent-host-death family protein
MLDLSRDIDSLSNFKRNSVAFIDRLKQTGAPVVLTVHGKAEIVVQDAKSYQRLFEAAEQIEAVEGIREGLAYMERGEGIPAQEAFDSLRRKHEIPEAVEGIRAGQEDARMERTRPMEDVLGELGRKYEAQG